MSNGNGAAIDADDGWCMVDDRGLKSDKKVIAGCEIYLASGKGSRIFVGYMLSPMLVLHCRPRGCQPFLGRIRSNVIYIAIMMIYMCVCEILTPQTDTPPPGGVSEA